MLPRGLAAVGRGRGQGLPEVDGSDEAEPSGIVLVRPDAGQQPLVGVGDGLQELLLRRREGSRVAAAAGGGGGGGRQEEAVEAGGGATPVTVAVVKTEERG